MSSSSESQSIDSAPSLGRSCRVCSASHTSRCARSSFAGRAARRRSSPTALPKYSRSRCRQAPSPLPWAIGRRRTPPSLRHAMVPRSMATSATECPVPTARRSASRPTPAATRRSRSILLTRIGRSPCSSASADATRARLGGPGWRRRTLSSGKCRAIPCCSTEATS